MHRMQRDSLPAPRIAKKASLPPDELILLLLRLGDLSTRIWLDVAPHLAGNILLRILFIGRSIRGIFYRNVNSYTGTHSLSQYWRMEKNRDISTHYITIYTIRTRLFKELWPTMPPTMLLESRDNMCCNPTSSAISSLWQNLMAYMPLNKELCP